MKQKLLPFAIFFTLIWTSHSAQVSAYRFTQSISSYSNSFTGPYLGHAYQDDTVNTFNLPFTFTFNGTPYTSVNLSSNGFISFGAINPTEYAPISSGVTQDVISAFGHNLQTGIWIRANITAGSNTLTGVSLTSGYSVGDSIIDWAGDFATPYPKIVNISGNTIVISANANVNSTAYDIHINNGCIRTALSGSTPTRVIEFEYQNFSRVNVFNDYVNFKIKLYETYNRVSVVYGGAVPGNSITTAQIGLKGSSGGDFNSRTVSGTDTYITTKPATVTTDGCEVSPSKMPSGGITYAWQPYCAIPGFSLTHTSPTVCAGETVTLTASGAQTYSWVGIDTTAQIIVNPVADTSYKLIVRWGFCIDSMVMNQTVNPSPTITVNKSSAAICAGSSVTLTAAGADTYSWTGIGADTSIVVTPSSTTDYTVTGTTDGCGNTKVETITVSPLPDVKAATTLTMVCKGWTSTLTASGASTFTWTHNNAQQPSVLVINLQNTTTYTVSGTSPAGCVNQATVTQNVQDCTGFEEFENAGLQLYPNPFGSQLNLDLLSADSAHIEILDISGRLMFSQYMVGDGKIETHAWPSGVYLIKVTTNGVSAAAKLNK